MHSPPRFISASGSPGIRVGESTALYDEHSGRVEGLVSQVGFDSQSLAAPSPQPDQSNGPANADCDTDASTRANVAENVVNRFKREAALPPKTGRREMKKRKQEHIQRVNAKRWGHNEQSATPDPGDVAYKYVNNRSIDQSLTVTPQ
jgi:hypothetical protein